MAAIAKVQVVLEGFNGAPGVNSWYFVNELGGTIFPNDVENFCDLIEDCYNTLKALLAVNVRATVDGVATIFDVEDGTLLGVIGTGTRTTITSTATTGSGALSRATQMNVRLSTDKIVGQRVLKGRHFIGPVASVVFESNGSLKSSVAATVDTAYAGMLDLAGLTRLAVWSQPKPERVGESGKVLPAQVGAYGLVQSADLQAIPGTLRSRKR